MDVQNIMDHVPTALHVGMICKDNFLRVTTPGGCQSIDLRQTLILSKDDGLEGGKKSMIWLNEAILTDFSGCWSKFSHFYLDWRS